MRAPGAGGFGAPAERDLARLRDDVINGYVSRESAATDYGQTDRRALECPACQRRLDESPR